MDLPISNGTLGVLGGMGPMASAAFIQTIYGMYRGEREQGSPKVLLNSNPQVQDRTAAFLSDLDQGLLLSDIESGLRSLVDQGAEWLVVCCITAHHLFPRLSRELREKTVSLIDLIFAELQTTRGKCLLACTNGSREMRLFEGHSLWPSAGRNICLPDHHDQKRLHDAIYRLKQSHDVGDLQELLVSLADRYCADNVIAGCTELHMLSSTCVGFNRLNTRIRIIDPLVTVAIKQREVLHAASVC